MGAKRLKAIAVRGSGTLNIAKPDQFSAAARSAREHLMESLRATRMRGIDAVLRDNRQETLNEGSLPAKNFQTGILAQFLETRGRDMAQKYVTKFESTCYSCPMSCFELVEVKEGKYAGVETDPWACTRNGETMGSQIPPLIICRPSGNVRNCVINTEWIMGRRQESFLLPWNSTREIY